MPTIHIEWSASRPPEAYASVASAVAEAVANVPGAAPTADDVLVYFDDLPVGDLYVDGVQFSGGDTE